jgi:hypothetical protein
MPRVSLRLENDDVMRETAFYGAMQRTVLCAPAWPSEFLMACLSVRASTHFQSTEQNAIICFVVLLLARCGNDREELVVFVFVVPAAWFSSPIGW